MCKWRVDTFKGFKEQCRLFILFSKADTIGCEAISDVLEKFCRKSSQKISHDKSRIYFSPNVSDELKEEISERLGVRETNNIGKYLRFPLKHRQTRKLDKINRDFLWGSTNEKRRMHMVGWSKIVNVGEINTLESFLE